MGMEITPIKESQGMGYLEAVAEHLTTAVVGLVGITNRGCYRCGRQGVMIAGVLAGPVVAKALLEVEDDLFLDFELVGEALRKTIPPAWLKAHFIGPLKVRRSRPRPEGYISNGCHSCDAIIGTSPLREAVEKIGMARLPEFVIGPAMIPLDALREAVNGVKLEWS